MPRNAFSASSRSYGTPAWHGSGKSEAGEHVGVWARCTHNHDNETGVGVDDDLVSAIGT